MSQFCKRLLIIICIGLFCIGSHALGNHERKDADRISVFRQGIRQKIEAFKREVENTLFYDSHEGTSSQNDNSRVLSRSKRATITADNPLLLGRQRRKITSVTDEGIYLVNNVFRVSPQYFDQVETFDINSLLIQNQTFMFTLELNKNKRTEVVVYRVGSGLNPTEIARTESPGATSLEVVEIAKQYYVLPLVYNWTENNSMDPMDVGSNLLKLDMVGRALVKVQTIRTAHARTSVFWQGSGEEANNIYLAVAPEFQETTRGRKYRVGIPCYRWQAGYFDYISTIPATNPQAIRHFNILSNDYLAVANYQDDSGSTNVHSELFKYHHKENRFISFQRIRTQGAKDIQQFSFKSGKRVENFIAVANHCTKDENGQPNYRVKSFIMKFASQRFIPFKSIYTYGALQFQPVSLGDKFYLVLVEIQRLRIFQYNGWSFVEVKKINIPEVGNSFFSMKLRPFFFENNPYFAVSSLSPDYQGGLYSVRFDQKNDYKKLASGLEKWCLAAANRLKEVNMTQLVEDVAKAPKTDQPEIVLNGDLIFKGPLTAKKISAQKMTFRGKVFDDKLANSLKEYQTQLEDIQKNVHYLDEQLDNAVFRDRDQEIPGKLIFANVIYNNPTFSSDDAILQKMNGLDLTKVISNLVLTNHDMQLESLKIEQAEFGGDAILNASTLNGFPLTDYAQKDNPSGSTFQRENTFDIEVPLAGQVAVRGHFAGLDFFNPKFILAQGNQTFQGTVRLRNSSVTNLYTLLLNSEDITHYFEDAVPLFGDVIITGQKTLVNIAVENLHAAGTVNGIGIDQVYSTAVYIKGQDIQALTGNVRFSNLVVDQLDLKEKLVNGKIDLAKDFLNVQHGSYELGDVTLADLNFIEDLNISNKLNKLDVTSGDLGVVLKASDSVQKLKNKNFQGIHFDVDVAATGLIDGVNLTSWNPVQRMKLRGNAVHKKFLIHGNLTTPRTKVTKHFHQGAADILGILKNIAPLNSTKLPGSCDLVFEELSVVGNTELKKEINGINPSSWLPNGRNIPLNITGEKNFFGNIILEDDCLANELYASMSSEYENVLDVLPNLLIDGENQVIKGDTVFMELLGVQKLDCPNIILDGIPFETLLLKNKNQEIQVPTRFEGLVKVDEEMEVYGDLDVGLVNLINLTEAIDDTLRIGLIDSTQIVQGEYKFEGGLALDFLETDGFFGRGRGDALLNLGLLFESLVLKNRKEALHLTGHKMTFEVISELQTLEYTGTMNEIPSSNWGRLWLLNTGNQTVYGPVYFQDEIQVDFGLHSNTGRVGDIDVMKLDRDILRINEGGHLNKVEFAEDVDAPNSIKMGPLGVINGLNLHKDVLRRSNPYSHVVSPQVVVGYKTFEEGLNIASGNMEASNIDGVNLNSALQFIYEKDPSVFENHTLIIQGDLKLKSEPYSIRAINGRDLAELLKTLWFTNQDVILSNRVYFDDVQFSGGATFVNNGSQLQGVDLMELQRIYVSKTKDQTWTGRVILKDPVSFANLQVADLVISYGQLNDITLSEFKQKVLTTGPNETFVGNLNLDNIQVNHLFIRKGPIINGVDLNKDIVSVTGLKNYLPERIIQDLTVHELIFDPNICTVNGINLSDWNLNAVKTYGDNILRGQLELDTLGEAADVRVEGLVDGVKVDRDHILLKNGTQVIPGKMILSANEYSEYDRPESAALLKAPEGVVVNGLFNNYDLNTTFGNLIRKSTYDNDTTTPLVISGEKKFLAPIRVDNIKTEKMFNGLNLTQLLGDFYNGVVIPPSLAFRANDHYEALHAFANQAFNFTRRAVFLEYFLFSQEIVQQDISYTRMLYGSGWPTLVHGIQDSELTSTESWWVYSLTSDLFQRQLGMRIGIQRGHVRDMLEIESNEGHYIVMAVQSVKNRAVAHTLETLKTNPFSEISKGVGRFSKTLILKEDSKIKGGWMATQTIFGKDFGPLENFVIKENDAVTHCVFITTLDTPLSTGDILCLDDSQVFKPYQSIPLDTPTLVNTLEAFDRTFILVATKGVTEPEQVIEVWVFSGVSAGFKKESCIPVFNPVSIDAIFGSNSNPFLAVASGPATNVQYLGAVFIYRYSLEKKEFEKVQTLEIDSPLEVRLHVLQPSKEVILFVLTDNPMNNVLVYKYQGVAGWSLRHKWTSENGRSLEVSDFEIEGIFKTQVLISNSNGTRIYTAEFKGLTSDSSLPDNYGDEDFEF